MKVCDICGAREHLLTERLCTRCASFLDAGFNPPFECEGCGGSEVLGLCNYGKSLVCLPCRHGTMGIIIDLLPRYVERKSGPQS